MFFFQSVVDLCYGFNFMFLKMWQGRNFVNDSCSCVNYFGFKVWEKLNCGGLWLEENLRVEVMELAQIFFVLTLDINDRMKGGLLESVIGQLQFIRVERVMKFFFLCVQEVWLCMVIGRWKIL